MNILLFLPLLFTNPDTNEYVTCLEGEIDTSLNHVSEPLYYSFAEDCRIVDYFAVADYQMYLDFGSNVSAVVNHIETVTALSNDDYQNAFSTEIQLNLVGTYVSTSPSADLWNDSTPTSIINQLSQFRSWDQSGGITVPHELASLWTGTDYSGSVIGIAYVGGVCRGVPYNVLEYYNTDPNMLRQLMTHEIGHNFSAGHDPSGTSFIMSPLVSGTNLWSSASIVEISEFIDDNNSCLTECTTTIDPEEPDTCIGDVTIYDTTFIPVNIPVTMYDTTIIPVQIDDTTYNDVIVNVYDTNVIIVQTHDTIITQININEYDTNITIINVVDTTYNNIIVVVEVTEYDTIIEYIYVTDTIIVDTIYITDTICDFTTGFGTPISPENAPPHVRGTYTILGQQIGAIRKSGYYIIDGVLYYVSF